MVLDNKETTVAYRCPECGSTVTSIIGIFALSGDMLKLKCACGGSELVITYTPDKKMRLSVPCIACPKPHNYMIGQHTFFSRDTDVFRLPCSYTGIDICFIGEKSKVSAAVEKANDELVKMMQDAGLDDMSRIRDDEEINVERDPQVEDVVRYAVSELNDEGKIKCRCQNNAIAKYDFVLLNGKATIYCEECDSALTIPMEGLSAAYRLLDSDGIVLNVDLAENPSEQPLE